MTPRIFERAYRALKLEVTSGRYKPGQRLQARALADILNASTSPVTNAMRQLVGERVLEYTDEDGFIIPWVNEQRLRDLLSWTAWLTTTGHDDLEATAGHFVRGEPDLPHEDIVAATEQLFLALVGNMQNMELTRNMGNSNDRLRAIRKLEEGLLPDRFEELKGLVQAWTEGNRPVLRRALGRYHRRRLDVVPQLVGLSYQDRH